jgi:hypothetical protein
MIYQIKKWFNLIDHIAFLLIFFIINSLGRQTTCSTARTTPLSQLVYNYLTSVMAVNGESNHIEQKISRLSIISDDGTMKIEAENELMVEDKHCAQKWGFKVKELYKLALRFYKGELELSVF